MIRRVRFSLKEANRKKQKELDALMTEAIRTVNLYIDELWERQQFFGRFVDFKVDTPLGATIQQALGKQALEIVKSQRRRKKKTKPVFKRPVLHLDSRFLDVRWDENTFDMWFRIKCLGRDFDHIRLPSRRHRHYIRLLNDGYQLKGSFRLCKTNSGYFIDMYMEKPEPPKKTEGKEVGIDCGYKKLMCDSDGNVYDKGLEACYEKISRRKQGSKGFRRALAERDNLTNASCNQVPVDDLRLIVAEELKYVKRGTKGKLRKSFTNKLQRWSYAKVLSKLSRLCEERGVVFQLVDPSYTSQTCNLCGHVDRKSRQGQSFRCTGCGHVADADINAARNVLHRGVYSPSAVLT